MRGLVFVMLVPNFAAISAAQAADDRVDYLRQIKPLLSQRCVACHGSLRQEGGLRVDAARLLRDGGDSGPAVEPGAADESLVVFHVTAADGFSGMPKEGTALNSEEIALIKRWIDEGAAAPADEPIAADPRDHWAFRPPVRPDVPQPGDADWVKTPIDAFIAARHDELGLTPQSAAPRHVLLRRVYLDLIGLPPTPEELRSFLEDDSPDAYERVVDRLLDSPRYGERWGRHWMDVWRYSDWYGYGNELRNSARHIWRWRDWIVESLNDDRPYDQMVREMLAADELHPDDRDRLRATGFLARHYFKFNRNTWLDDTVEHTGKAFLGLTLNCAKCHDHMYDPLAQKEYYQFRAIFEPYQVRTDRLAGEADTSKDGLVSVYDGLLDAKTFVFERGNDLRPDKDHPVDAGIPLLFASIPFDVRPIAIPADVQMPALRLEIREALEVESQRAVDLARRRLAGVKRSKASALADLRLKRDVKSHVAGSIDAAVADGPAVVEAIGKLNVAELDLRAAELELISAEARQTALGARLAADSAKLAGIAEQELRQLSAAAARAERTAALRQAEADLARAEAARERAAAEATGGKPDKQKALDAARTKVVAARKALESAAAALDGNDEKYTPVGPVYPATSTGRRAALAGWITDRRNPLTARVAVNHIWMRHFGQPLVPTVFDFGLNGKPPTHPALLDWLAVELMESGWRMKPLHRLIVLSSAYRLHSSPAGAAEANLRLDPDNQQLWRMNARRMEAEAVRDSVLAVAGQLDLTMGGPDLDQKTGGTTYRRSLYYRHAPEKFVPFLQTFDLASTTECYRRNETVVPQQALAMANSPLVREQARRLAGALGTGDPDAEFVRAAFFRVLGREPSADEITACTGFLAGQAEQLGDAGRLSRFSAGTAPARKPADDARQRARESLVHVLLNHNDFVTIR